MRITDLIGVRDITELMLDAVCIVDREGRLTYVNNAFEQMFGYAPREAIGRNAIDFVHTEDKEKTLCTVDTLLEDNIVPSFENRWLHKDGRTVHVLWSARWSEQHQARIAVAHEITKRKKLEHRLQHMAGHDQLTDLPNRVLLMDRLKTALAQSRREQSHLSLLFIDMDGFKQVNDVHGHLSGDSLLQKIAQRLLECVRNSDTVGRLGGDEFLILLKGTGKLSEAVMIAEKIRHALAQPFEFDELKLSLSPSIGISYYPEHGDCEQQLIQRADQAMYKAKESGGNCVTVFKP